MNVVVIVGVAHLNSVINQLVEYVACTTDLAPRFRSVVRKLVADRVLFFL